MTIDSTTNELGQSLAQGIKDKSPEEVDAATFMTELTGANPAEVLVVAGQILGEDPGQVADEADALLADSDDFSEDDAEGEDD